ncbi:hypothetical protein EDD86DRAFT_215781 [Gorgonomyces haynaldii]|nr:hypothetical protein EDD86DRAFT_215781 [Gorgonomyces haynaldii]
MLQLVQNIKHILKQDQVPQLLTTMLSMFQKIPDDDKPIMVSELLILGRQANVKNMLSLVSRELFKWSKQSSPLLSLGLLQINYSLKQDQQLCQDFYKTLKQNTELLFDHMNLELVLLVMNQKGNEPLLDLLANTILNQYKLEARSKSLEWIQTNTQVERIERRLLSIFESTGQLGWDQIIISSLTLILRLQEQVHLIPDKQMSDRLSDLVSNVLQLLFQKMPMLQQTILDHLMTGSKKYVHQIKKLCEKCPNEVIKHMNLVSEMIESLLQTADEHLLEALVLLCDNQQVYDKMMMVLRKGSIQREQLCRELSIKGYALLLKTNKHTDELLGGLRRAFAQQLSCRVLAYQKLLEFALLNEGIRVHVLGLFHRQLLTYKQERFPLSIEKCYENGKIQEALAMLVHCTSYLAHLTKSKPILDFLTRVAEQASKVELADFDMVQADEPLKQDRLYLAVSLLHSLFCHALLLQDGQTLANCLQKKIQAFMDSRKEKGQVLLAKAMNEGISTESRMLFLTLLSAAAKKQANLPLCQQLFASLVGKDQLKQMEKKQSLLLTEAFEQSLLQLEHPFQVFQMESKTVCKLLLQCANQLSAEQPKQGIKFLKILDHLLSKEKIHLTEPLYSILQNNESHDPHFCRETVLMWARSLNKHPKALLKLSESIFVIYGQRIQNDQDLGENRLKLVNNETVAHAVTAFLSFIDQQLESMDWVTQNWKMFDNLDLVSERMGLFVSLVEMLCQTSLPSDTNDMIVKTLTRLYKIMANIAKLVPFIMIEHGWSRFKRVLATHQLCL